MRKPKRNWSLATVVATTLMAAVGIGATSTAEAKTARNCFRDHLRDAIEINRARLPLYAELTNSESIPVSMKLIALEKLTLAASKVKSTYGIAVAPYRKAGVDILCENFVDMRQIPAFHDRYAAGAPDLSTFVQPHGSDIRKRIRVGLSKKGFPGAYAEAVKALRRIEDEPRFNCMLRHTLESIARIAAYAPNQEARAKRKGLPSPARISKELIEDHLIMLRQVMDLDWKAASIQASGVPILCQDVPPIQYSTAR